MSRPRRPRVPRTVPNIPLACCLCIAAGAATARGGEAVAEPKPDPKAAAERFLRETLRHVPAGEERRARLKKTLYHTGDLFRAGHDVAFAVLLRRVCGEEHGWDEGFACAFYSRRGGAWRLRNVQSRYGSGHGTILLRDLTGDDVPEALYALAEGAHNASYAVLRYDAAADNVHVACEEISSPEWRNGWVRTIHSSGRAGSDNCVGCWRWQEGRLRRQWYSDQSYDSQKYVIATGEDVVKISHYDTTGDGEPRLMFTTRGNLGCFRNGGGYAWPLLAAIWRSGDEERYVEIVPDMKLLKEPEEKRRFGRAVSRLVHENRIALSENATFSVGEGRELRVGDVASLRVTKRLPVFFIASRLRAFENPDDVAEKAYALSVGTARSYVSADSWHDSLRRRKSQVARSGRAVPGVAWSARTSPYLYLAGPVMAWHSSDRLLITRADVDGSRISLEAEMRRYPPSKEKSRCVRRITSLPLERLEAGSYTVSAKVTVVRYERANNWSFAPAGRDAAADLALDFDIID